MKYLNIKHGEHCFVLLRLNSARSLLHRLEGNHEIAVGEVDKLVNQQQQAPQSQRDNAAMGHVVLQRALNSIQVDDLIQAEQILGHWRHLGDDEPSLMEHVVYFRRDVMLGRVLRARGRFAEAHTHLKRSYDLAAQHHGLDFDEDRRDLISELADTLLELDKPYDAEAYLRIEFARRSRDMNDPAKSGKSLLEASMAEVLLAQGRTEEAEHVCSQAEARWDELMRLGKFRICIVRAKIHHTRSDYATAVRYWDMALQQASIFQGETGATTRILVLSRQVSRQASGLTDPEAFERCTDLSTVPVKPGGTLYWIAGMRHWENFVRSEAARTRV
ncbi:hypothetical protein KVR01_002252 [Diaporthe batatas]|uniref:uncharacterized protein n=1 Tax=Diaporthe batatas TaxID=748121 RepID=UPI001D0379EE|nr:uncharacterized protein KVR01_002252 [Diaporthe batatas]KAG8166563.1 hypothetical protein KVR01_002252 [Diaporthe batatas]